jgi:dihydroflavonol-4-reductase
MILVTGAAGHIGNVLVRELLDDGQHVRALIMPGENISALEGLDIEFIEGNVLEAQSLDKAMLGVEKVFHLAGIISIMPGQDDLIRRVNVEGTKNVLRAAKKAGVKRLVYTSSIHALSRDWKGKIDEQVPFDKFNPAGEYDRTKAEASLAVLEAVDDGLDAVIVCPTGVIGPHDYRGSEMGDLLRNFMRRKPHLMIEGAYDFVDVRDAARGHILASERGRKGEVYILSGWQIKIFQLKQMVQEVLGLKTTTIHVPNWLAKFSTNFTPLFYRLTKQTPKFTGYSIETVQGNSDISSQKARKELGYNPRLMISTIADTVKWWLKHDKKAQIS